MIKTRASQLNACAFCLHLHTREARLAGETEERLYLLSAWRESPLYTPRERAAPRAPVRDARPRYDISAERGAEIARAFYVASRVGDVSALRQLLADDVISYSDGGGKRSTATKPVVGSSRVCQRFAKGASGRKSELDVELTFRVGKASPQNPSFIGKRAPATSDRPPSVSECFGHDSRGGAFWPA